MMKQSHTKKQVQALRTSLRTFLGELGVSEELTDAEYKLALTLLAAQKGLRDYRESII
jgi:hypothetical protein